MSDGAPRLPEAELAELERAVAHALETGDVSGLDILGYGEISCVVGTKSNGHDLACKRLPLFRDARDWESYQQVFAEYLATLESKGIRPLASTLQTVPRPDRALSAWCVQPRLASAGLLSKHFHSASESEALDLFERVLGAIVSSVGPTVGLDGQLSNWILAGGELRYLDVTTPMLRTRAGAERMPIAVFLASLPWALRPAVRRFMLRDILNKYYDPRGVVLDVLGNFHKEKLERLLPACIERANSRVSPELGAEEVKRYYESDASSWALLQRLRHADRWWQRRIRRRVYPFLLPGKIER
jgi:Family of unknown function (DUF6206)